MYLRDYPKVCVNLQTDVKTELLSMEVIFMSRRKDSPQKAVMRGLMHEYLKNNDISIKNGTDVNSIMQDMMSVLLEGALDEELNNELELFKNNWYSKYPKIYKSWHDNWATLSTYFKYPEAVRRLIYTTNAIEGFNYQLRKVTKAKTIFPSDDSLLKMLYLATMDIIKKWTAKRQDWGQIHSQLEIYFEEHLSGHNL